MKSKITAVLRFFIPILLACFILSGCDMQVNEDSPSGSVGIQKLNSYDQENQWVNEKGGGEQGITEKGQPEPDPTPEPISITKRYAPINVKATQVGEDIHITWSLREDSEIPAELVIRYTVPSAVGGHIYYWSVIGNPNNPEYVIFNGNSAIVKEKDIGWWHSDYITDSENSGHFKFYDTRTFNIMVSAIYWNASGYQSGDGAEHLSNPYSLKYKF